MPALRILPCILLLAAVPIAGIAGERPVLTVLNWSWYVEIDEDADPSLPVGERSPVLIEFEEEFGCDVQYLELDEEVAMRDLLTARPDEIDVVNLSAAFCTSLHQQGLLRSIDLDKVPHAKDLRPAVLEAMGPDGLVASVPYFAGHTGLLVNRTVTGRGPFGWSEFWNATSSVPIGVLGGPETVLGTILVLQGRPISSNDPSDLRTAATLLLENLRAGRIGYVGDDVEEVGSLVSDGRLGAAILYSSDALSFVDDENLVFVLPSEGVEMFVDCWGISSRTRQSDLAHAFVDFMLRPEIQVRQGLDLEAQVVTRTARAILEREHADDPHLPFLIGIENAPAGTQSPIQRDDTTEIERLWARVLGSLGR